MSRPMSLTIAALALAAAVGLRGQTPATATTGEWRAYGADARNTRYLPLDQINAANFSNLEVAWRFKTDSLGPRPEFQFEGTPVMAGRIVVSTAGAAPAVGCVASRNAGIL